MYEPRKVIGAQQITLEHAEGRYCGMLARYI